MQKIIGTGVALITPFDTQLKVDWDAMKKLLTHLQDSHVDYLVIHGTTGEAATTTTEEKKAIHAFIAQHNIKNIPIVWGVSGNNTSEIVAFISSMDWSGIDAAMVASPYYNKPSQEGIFQHYKTIADNCPVPILLYNVPSRTGSNISAQTAIRLSKHPNIIGIKEASGDLAQCIAIAQGTDDDFLLISGDDLLTPSMIAIGGSGVISTIANGFPKTMCLLVKLCLENNFHEAQEYLKKLLPLCELINQEGNPVGTKQLLHALDICLPNVRLPLIVPELQDKAINKSLFKE